MMAFGLESLTFAVLQTPEDSLSCIASDGEVGRLDTAEILVEYRLVAVVLPPPIGNRVSIKQEVDIALARGLYEA